jgi:hypothetical protein
MKPAEVPGQLRSSIADFLRRFVWRRRRVALVRALSLSVMFGLLWLLAWGVVDRFMGLPALVRTINLLLLAGIVAWLLRRPVAAWLDRRIDWLAAARQLDRRDPRFNELLPTIVSESMDRRGSAQLLEQLVLQAETCIAEHDPRRLVRSVPARNAAMTAGIAVLAYSLLCGWPWLGLPRLTLRQIAPFASTPPVTTTRLILAPVPRELVQGKPLTISVRAEPLLGGTVLLRMSSDEQTWASVGMNPAPGGAYTYTIPSLLRDLKYQLTAGDAQAGPFTVHVLRRPLLRELHIRLTYPSYVGRDPLEFISTDGAIEAPVGTLAQITLVATEPLKDASVIIDGERLATDPTSDLHARESQLRITHDARWSVEMVSAREVPGTGSSDMTIRAKPDRPPVARLVLPPGASLLRPRDLVRIPYQAADDYALTSLEARIEVDSKPPIVMPLQLGPDPRRCEDLLWIDLAQCNVVLGQRVRIFLAATDRAGRTTLSQPCEILISPNAIGPEQRRNVSDLRDAAQLAARVADDLRSAARLLEDRPRALARISNASESAAALVRSLLRAGVGVREPQPAAMLGLLADAAQLQASRLEALSTQATVDPTEALRSRLDAAQEAAGQFALRSEALSKGLHAQLLLAQLQNLAAAGGKQDALGARLREEIDAGLLDLRISSGDPEVEQRLAALAEDAGKRIGSATPVDFAAAASQWARSAQPQTEFLAERLLTAAQAEAVRGDADLIWARDLQLASRAARTIDALVAPAGAAAGATPDVRQSFADALAALQASHLDPRDSSSAASSTQPALAQDTGGTRPAPAAARARGQMLAWAGESELAADAAAPAPADEQSSAFDASALTSQRQYSQAQSLDERLFSGSPQARQRVQSEMNRVRRIDAVDAQQQKLSQASGSADAAGTASRERELGAQIGEIDRERRVPGMATDSREQGLHAVRRMQDELADVPQRLARIDEAIQWARQSRDLAQQAAREAETAPPTRRDDAVSNAQLAQTQADDAFDSLVEIHHNAELDELLTLAADLQPFAPETSAATGVISRQLKTALDRLSDRVRTRDPEGAARAVADGLRATAAAQEALREARKTLLDRDPLVAARWFADQAADMLDPSAPATSPASSRPSAAQVREQQLEAASALRRAWDESIHRAAEARLAGIASMASILRMYGFNAEDAAGAGRVAAMPDWGRFQPWQEQDLSAAVRTADPQEYQDALRAYFRVLAGNEPEGKSK